MNLLSILQCYLAITSFWILTFFTMIMQKLTIWILTFFLCAEAMRANEVVVPNESIVPEKAWTDTLTSINSVQSEQLIKSIYAKDYSLTYREPQWHKLWINTAVLSGAYVSTLLVLQCLPEDATSWNRAEIRDKPIFKRWFDNVFKRGPEWDSDNVVFNYILHPYAGATYFMSARSCGFNFYQSLLYSACVSTIGWEFGIEAFMERPSYQDLLITPLVGSAIGELFYMVKRHIVSHDYTLAGSRLLGNIVVFLVDPINEFVDIFRGNDERKLAKQLNASIVPSHSGKPSISLCYTF